MRKKLRAGILAATGTVGQRFIELFAYQPNSEITALAASASAGKTYREACAWQLSSDPPAHVADMEMDRSSHYRALDPMVRDEWVKIRAGTNALSRTAVITSIRVPGSHQRWKAVGTGADESGRTVRTTRMERLCSAGGSISRVCQRFGGGTAVIRQPVEN